MYFQSKLKGYYLILKFCMPIQSTKNNVQKDKYNVPLITLSLFQVFVYLPPQVEEE